MVSLWPYLLSQCISVLEFAKVRDFLSAFQRLYQGSIHVTVSVSIVTSLWRNRQRYDSVDSHLKQNATEWKCQVVFRTSLWFKTKRRDGSRVATLEHSVYSAWSLQKRWTYLSLQDVPTLSKTLLTYLFYYHCFNGGFEKRLRGAEILKFGSTEWPAYLKVFTITNYISQSNEKVTLQQKRARYVISKQIRQEKWLWVIKPINGI